MTRSEVKQHIAQIEQQIAACQELLEAELTDAERINIEEQIQRQQDELTNLYELLASLPEEEVNEPDYQGEFYEEPTPAEATWSLETWKYNLKNSVRTIRKQKENAGITAISESGTSYLFDTSLTGRSNLMAVLNAYTTGMLNPTTDTVHWKFMNNKFVDITYDQLRELGSFALLYVEALFVAESQHYQKIDSLTSVDEAKAYDVSSNWPDNRFDSKLLP